MGLDTEQLINVSATSIYQERYSQPEDGNFVYAYRIRVENAGARPVQLLDRRWEITDGVGQKRLVVGDGVVGKQPWIEPGQSFEYNSWVQFPTPIGAMKGSYGMSRRNDDGRDEFFRVVIPKFLHVATPSLN